MPAHWNLARFKHTFRERRERSVTGEELLLSVSAYSGVTPRSEVVAEGDNLSRAESLDGYKICRPGDLVMNIMLAWNRGLAFTSYDGIVSPAYCVFEMIGANDSRFLNYQVRSDQYILYYKAFSAGVIDSRLRIYPETFLRLYHTLPTIAEQLEIAAFLDRETAKIDALVTEQQQLIELLKEKRKAFIFHAVTKGVNQDAPMKPSGVEWLGDLPEHWNISPLKHLVTFRSGGTPSKANFAFWDGDVPWASSKDLKKEELSDTQDHITQAAIDQGVAGLVPPGSLLVVVRGMILLHTFPVVKPLVPMAINQDLKALTPSPRLDRDFLAWLLRGSSRETLSRTDQAAHGTTVIRMETWTSMKLPVPPIDEQQAIVTAILSEMRKLDALTADSLRAIDLLNERRTALVSAAVTGQMDVRGLVKSVAA